MIVWLVAADYKEPVCSNLKWKSNKSCLSEFYSFSIHTCDPADINKEEKSNYRYKNTKL